MQVEYNIGYYLYFKANRPKRAIRPKVLGYQADNSQLSCLMTLKILLKSDLFTVSD